MIGRMVKSRRRSVRKQTASVVANLRPMHAREPIKGKGTRVKAIEGGIGLWEWARTYAERGEGFQRGFR